LLYSLAFVVTWTPSTLWSIISWSNIDSTNLYWLDIISATFEPLQGLWNLCIFIRNRPDSIERLQSIFCYCCCYYSKTPSITFDFGIDSNNVYPNTNNSQNNNISSQSSSSKELSTSNKSSSNYSISNHRYLQTTSDRIDSIQKEVRRSLQSQKQQQQLLSHPDDDEYSVGAVRQQQQPQEQQHHQSPNQPISSSSISKKQTPTTITTRKTELPVIRRSGRSTGTDNNSIEYFISGTTGTHQQQQQVEEEISSTGQLSEDGDDEYDEYDDNQNHSQLT
jgi:hypothetical protein